MGIHNEMIQTFKTQSKCGKQKFTQIYESFHADIGQMNQSQAREELITQYLNQKEQQYTEQYNPKFISEIKEPQVIKLWNVLFKTTYNQSDSELIRKTVSKLYQRFRIMGDHAPPFFGLLVIKILYHPQTDILSKQVIYIFMIKFNLNIISFQNTNKYRFLRHSITQISFQQRIEMVSSMQQTAD